MLFVYVQVRNQILLNDRAACHPLLSSIGDVQEHGFLTPD